MNPVSELINSLSKRSPTTGIVLQVAKTTVMVSTNRGVKTLPLATQTPIKAGDKISVVGNQAVAKLTPDDDVPQYVV